MVGFASLSVKTSDTAPNVLPPANSPIAVAAHKKSCLIVNIALCPPNFKRPHFPNPDCNRALALSDDLNHLLGANQAKNVASLADFSLNPAQWTIRKLRSVPLVPSPAIICDRSSPLRGRVTLRVP